MADLVIGTAGWSIPARHAQAVPAEGSQLQRYATALGAVEINSSFYRLHRPETYARWAASTPASFRFAVKCPRAITHEARLAGAEVALADFIAQAGALGEQWAVLLVQLPPSLAFDADVARHFFREVRNQFGAAVVCEPRHASWFTPEADALLRRAWVSRAAADPARTPAGGEPGGWPGLAYFRWHGSPQMYRSAYTDDWLAAQRARLPRGHDCWCIFDNTASGAALGDALRFQALAAQDERKP